jgi:hypothetical protein
MINEKEAILAAARFSILKFYPSEPAARSEVALLMMSLCATQEQLDWLVSTVVAKLSEWPGPGALRGMFCTRFKPLDGIEANCSIAGFTAEDGEAAASYQQIEAPRAQKMLVAGEVAELVDGKWKPLGKVEVDPISRAQERIQLEAKRDEAHRRLGDILKMPVAPIRIPGSRKRTPAENEQILRELKERIVSR